MSSGSGNINDVVNFGGSAMRVDTANGIPSYITIAPGNLSSVVTLVGGVAASTGGNYYGFYSASSPASQAQYQVPSGKTYYCLGFYLLISTSDGNVQFGYGTAALASEGTASAPTGAIYYSASSTASTSGFVVPASSVYGYYAIPMSFPALSYPFFHPVNSQEYRLIMIGYVQ